MKGFSEVEQELLFTTPNCLRLEGYLHDHNLPLKEFIYFFLTRLNKKHSTYTNNVRVNYRICGKGFKRSIGEIFLICRFYYPDCRLKEVFNILIRIPNIHISFCSDIDKHVYSIEFSKYEYKYISSYTGEYQWKLNRPIPD